MSWDWHGHLLSTDKPSDQWWLTAPISRTRAQLHLCVNLSRLLPCSRGGKTTQPESHRATQTTINPCITPQDCPALCLHINTRNTHADTHVYAPPPTDVCIWWVGTVSKDAEDWGSWWSGRFAGRGLFYIPPSQSLSPLLKRYNPLEWRRGSPQRTSSSGNSSWWPWGRGWSRSSPRWRCPSWSSWPGPPGRWCPRPRWRPARWW